MNTRVIAAAAGRTPRPEDPVCSGISISTAPRATAQARYAAEFGLAFQEVQCLRVYVHVYTRQEAWDEYGRDREMERRRDEKGVGWYFGLNTPVPSEWRHAPPPLPPGVTTEGYYYDDVDDSGLHQPVSTKDAAYIEGAPMVVPDDWEPDFDQDPAWFRTTKDDPRAIPAWESQPF